MQKSAFGSNKLLETLGEIQAKLNSGFAFQAERIAFQTLENYQNTPDAKALLICQISAAYIRQGRFNDSLEILQDIANDGFTDTLEAENQASVLTQSGIAHVLNRDSKKAINFLNKALRIAEERDFTHLFAGINLAFARHYRELNEYAIARNYVERAIKSAREIGDWHGLAESFRANALLFQQTGDNEKSNEIYQQAVKIIGDRSAPYLLARIYSEMSFVNAALHQYSSGIEHAKKALAIFGNCDDEYHKVNTESALGLNLLFKGDWKKAESYLNQSAEKALDLNHHQIALFICNAAQLQLLQGDFAEVENLLIQANTFADESKKDWIKIQISYYWSLCLLAQKRSSVAVKKAEETIERCKKINETRFKSLILLVLADNCIQQNQVFEAEGLLQQLEEKEASENFYIKGSIATLRGLLGIQKKDDISAIHFYTQSVSNFEKIDDAYQLALARFKLGKILAKSQPDQAKPHLLSALEVFRKLDLQTKIEATEEYLAQSDQVAVDLKTEKPLQSNLLLLRLLKSISTRNELFRELIAVLQEVEKTPKLILSESNGNKFLPTIVEGFSPTHGVELVAKIQTMQPDEDINKFADARDLSIFHLHAPHANPAILITQPALKSTLSDGSLLHPLLKIVELGMELCALRERSKVIEAEIDSGHITTNNLMPGFIHSSPAMTEVVDEIHKIRTSDVTVLITGESGTGKELIAKAVHLVSRRKDKAFVPFNCTAVPRELTEGHLFGYRKGSFTGAVADSPGVIRAADGGTLFLDEIGDLPLDVQPKLLRFLQEGEVQTLGEKSPTKVNVRIIAATNMYLEEKVRQGLFREDLYYRLNVIRLRVPALRDRRSEIPELVNHYIKHYSSRFGRKDLTISSRAMDMLIAENWKGNIRQLCNEIQRIVARSDNGDKIGPDHLSDELKHADDKFAKMTGNLRATTLDGGIINVQTLGGSMKEAVSALEIQLISKSLARHEDNIARAAKELGLTRRGLYLKIERYKMLAGLEEIDDEE